MPPEQNVDLVREAWDAWLRGSVDDLFAFFHPEIVWDMTHFRDWPDATYRGDEGVRRFLDDWLEVWDEYEVGVDELLPVPDGRVRKLCREWGSPEHRR